MSKFVVKLSKTTQGLSASATSQCQKYVAFGTVRGRFIMKLKYYDVMCFVYYILWLEYSALNLN